MNVKIVTTIDELRAVWRLTHDAYVRAKLIEPTEDGMFAHRREYDLLDDTTLYGATTVAYILGKQNEMVATVSMTLDSRRGLPDEETHPIEIAEIRDECQYYDWILANCWRIETEGTTPSCAIGTLLDWCYDFCVTPRTSVDVVVMTCKPRHAKFYKRAMGFEQLGKQSIEAGFADAPSVLLRWDRRKHQDIWPSHRHSFLCERWASSHVLGD